MSSPPDRPQQDRWRTLMELFDAAAELPPEERAAFLDSADCAPDIRDEVYALLDKLQDLTGPRVTRNLAVPDRIGRYQVLEPLGRGGMGQVFQARDMELDRRVAVKFLSMDSFGGKPVVETLLREAKALSALNHPNIVTVHEVIQSDTACGIVMELVDGTSLREATGEPFPPRQVVVIGQQIALALAAAHTAGIVHRDVKPENVMVRKDGYAKVLDFGLAWQISSPSQMPAVGAAAGTVRYMSPEQTRGAALTGATDVFSLGLVLYELATGLHPFPSTSLLETAHAIASTNPAKPSSLHAAVPEALDSLILSMLAKDPAVRPSAAAVASRLADMGGVQAAVPQPRKLSRRWLAGAALSAATVIGASAYWTRRGTDTGPVRILVEEGESEDPVFSPDGSRVAFSWKAADETTAKLSIIDAAGGAPRLLTGGRVSNIDPAWSPDGKRICFVRQGLGENAVYLTAVDGGAERRIATLLNSSSTNRIDWLRDNRTIAVSENWYSLPIALIDVETGDRRNLPGPPEGMSDTAPKCSPDGKWIALTRLFTHTTCDLFVVPVGGGDARRLTFDGAIKPAHCWSPDGRGVFFNARSQSRWRLWYMPLEGGKARELSVKQAPAGSFDVRSGRNGGLDIVSADHYQVMSISKMEIPEAGGKPSRPVRMIASEDRGLNFECNPAVSPDGLKIAFISTRTGSPEIWVSDAEGSIPRQMTSLGGPEVTQPAWSPDGQFLLSAAAPESGRNLFRIEVNTGTLKWLTAGGKEETEPQWSRDGRWITFASLRTGVQELWRMPAAGGAARRLTRGGAAVHRESPDGRWLYYVRHEQPGLWRIRNDGSKAELILGRVTSDLYRAWAVGRKGIYYTYKDPASPKWTVFLYDPESRSERAVAVFERPLPRWSGTLTVTPDERWMLLPIIEARRSRLVLFSGAKV